MSIFYFLNRNQCLRCISDSYKSLWNLRILNNDSSTKTITRYITNDSSGFNTESKPIPQPLNNHLNHNHDHNHNNTSEVNHKSSLSYLNSMQIHKLVMDYHTNMDTVTLLKNCTTLCNYGLSDPDIVSILSERLLSNLSSVMNPHLMSRFLRALNPSSQLQYEFYKKLVDHIYENKIYPNMVDSKQWTTYFTFFGRNRILHTKLYNELLDIYIKYLDMYILNYDNTNSSTNSSNNDNTSNNHTNNNMFNKDNYIERSSYDQQFKQLNTCMENENKPWLEKKIQESIATVCWCLCICGIRNEELIDRVIKIIDTYNMYPPTLVRIYWTFSILGTRLDEINLFSINSLLQSELNQSILLKKSTINQILAILTTIKYFKNDNGSINQENRTGSSTSINGSNDDYVESNIDIDSLIDQCLTNLTKCNYHNSGKMVSKSQKLFSDFLVRSNIPHKFEILTDELISIDISIVLDDEKIAIEVDGPIHFLRNIENKEDVRKTEPSLYKERLLKKLGWVCISVPTYITSKDQNINVKEADEFYRSMLMKYNCSKLNKLLKKSTT